MALENFSGKTFVAFLDISGFKELMKKEKAISALDTFYQAGYEALSNYGELKGIFVSDSGILYATEDIEIEKFRKILEAVKYINKQMLDKDYMLKASIAFGEFNYYKRIELPNISKGMILGNAYLSAYLDSQKVDAGLCRIIKANLPEAIVIENFPLLKQRGNYYYYYWNISENSIDKDSEINKFEEYYKNSKYLGILKALKNT